jgi:hypothetical protein
MRETALVVYSLAHLPQAKRAGIEQAIRQAPRNVEGRLDIHYPDLVTETHLDGFFIHTSAADWSAAERPEGLPCKLWDLLRQAADQGAACVSFHREASSTPGLPILSSR